MRSSDHGKRVACGKHSVKDNYLVIRMMVRFVTQWREVTRHEGVAGGVDSNELWKSFLRELGAIKEESNCAPFGKPNAKGMPHPAVGGAWSGSSASTFGCAEPSPRVGPIISSI